ncbi:MAG: hypothetical protein HP008_02560 [Clostridia bacterium]|nr:hypothetical protein [Clostridia bacterium]
MNYNLALFALMFLLINGGVIDTTEALIFLALVSYASGNNCLNQGSTRTA